MHWREPTYLSGTECQAIHLWFDEKIPFLQLAFLHQILEYRMVAARISLIVPCLYYDISNKSTFENKIPSNIKKQEDIMTENELDIDFKFVA